MKILRVPSPRSPKLREIGLYLRNLFYYLKNEANPNDIIITFIPSFSNAFISILVARLCHCKIITIFFNPDYGFNSFNFIIARALSEPKKRFMYYLMGIVNILSQAIIPFIFASSNLIILSTPIAFDHEPLLRLFRHNSIVIYGGVSSTQLNIGRKPVLPAREEKTSLLLFVSKLTFGHEYKGLDILLKALKILKSKHFKARLLVVGEGPLKQIYAKLSSDLGLSLNQDVSFLGYIDDAQLSQLYSQTDIFVLPSRNKSEGLGLVAIEAMAAGKPIVTTKVAGVSHYILCCGGGLVVNPNDPMGLANTLETLIKNKRKAKFMGLRSRKFVEKYLDWNIVGMHFRSLILELTQQK
jgi:glycosyltransferase involved in cell wall biosynthesis